MIWTLFLHSYCTVVLMLCYLTHVVNESFLTGRFPDIFKFAIVRPLLKKPSLDPNSLTNYRPVSNLSIPSKIIEKVVLSQVLAHLQQNNLLNPNQSAYRQGHRTETALIKIVNGILLGFDDDKLSVLALLDLSAAFDTIDHSILLHRLQCSFGIQGDVLSWFQSYLADRKHSVCVNGLYSAQSVLTYGVPQGSILGPILYSTPVSDVISRHGMSHQSFADDTQLHQTSSFLEIDRLISRTQDCITDLKTWMTHNKLQLNDSKTDILIACPKKFLNHPSIPQSVLINNTPIQPSPVVRNLGVYLDQNLTFQHHINHVCKLAYLELRRISSIRHYLSTDATKTLICAFVLSRIDYCNSLLAGSPKCLLDKLQRLQNNAARLIFRSKKFDHVTPLLRPLHWLPISERIDYKLSTMAFSVVNESSPQYLSELLHIYTPSRQLRSSADAKLLKIPLYRHRTSGDRSFSFQAASVWNTLPISLRHSDSLESFKTGLKTHLFSSSSSSFPI